MYACRVVLASTHWLALHRASTAWPAPTIPTPVLRQLQAASRAAQVSSHQLVRQSAPSALLELTAIQAPKHALIALLASTLINKLPHVLLAQAVHTVVWLAQQAAPTARLVLRTHC